MEITIDVCKYGVFRVKGLPRGTVLVVRNFNAPNVANNFDDFDENGVMYRITRIEANGYVDLEE